jgi:hypothetical protein
MGKTYWYTQCGGSHTGLVLYISVNNPCLSLNDNSRCTILFMLEFNSSNGIKKSMRFINPFYRNTISGRLAVMGSHFSMGGGTDAASMCDVKTYER